VRDSAAPAAAARSADHGGLAVILLASFLFGVMAVCVRVAARELPALQIAFFRFSGSLVVLLAATRGRELKPRPGTLGHLILRGLVGAVAISLYFVGIRHAGAGLATLVQNTYPVFATFFAWFFLAEPVSWRSFAALAMSLSGVAVVVGPELRLDAEIAFGALASLAAATLSGGAVVAARNLRFTESASLITTYFMAVGALVCAPSLLYGVPAPSSGALLALCGVVLTSVAAQWLLHHGLGFVSATRGSLAAATSVVTASLIEGFATGVVPGGEMLLGAVLMIGATGLAAGGAPPGAAAARAAAHGTGEPVERAI
jgi:drug/metabolite transporter (DMT)-like permease